MRRNLSAHESYGHDLAAVPSHTTGTQSCGRDSSYYILITPIGDETSGQKRANSAAHRQRAKWRGDAAQIAIASENYSALFARVLPSQHVRHACIRPRVFSTTRRNRIGNLHHHLLGCCPRVSTQHVAPPHSLLWYTGVCVIRVR